MPMPTMEIQVIGTLHTGEPATISCTATEIVFMKTCVKPAHEAEANAANSVAEARLPLGRRWRQQGSTRRPSQKRPIEPVTEP